MTTVKPEDLDGMTEQQLAYAVICQLSVACAVLANVARNRRTHPEPFKPEEFMIGYKDRTESLSAAMRAALEFGEKCDADAPVILRVGPQG